MRVMATMGRLLPFAPAPRQAGGGFLRGLARRGHQVHVHVPDGPVARKTLPHETGPAVVHCYPNSVGRLGPLLPSTARALRRAVEESDVVYNVDVWDLQHLVADRAARRARVPYVVSTHGGLHPRARRIRRFRKAVAWRAYQRPILESAAALHAMSPEEAQVLSTLVDTPTFVVPFGIDAPPHPARSQPDPASPQLLFMGRLVPSKGLDVALGLLAHVRHQALGARLHVAGDSDLDAYKARLQRQVNELGLADSVAWHGWVDGPAKWDLIRQCDLLLMPSEFESFGTSMVEALSQGTPVLRSAETRMKGLETGAGVRWLPRPDWNGPRGAEAVANALDDHRTLARQAPAYVAEHHSWPTASRRLEEALLDVAGRERGGP